MGDAQRKRWAESKKESASSSPVAPKTKRKLSAAGKKAIADATKETLGQGESRRCHGGQGPTGTRRQEGRSEESAGEGCPEGREEGCCQAGEESRRDCTCCSSGRADRAGMKLLRSAYPPGAR
jgi:hypothetical protein